MANKGGRTTVKRQLAPVFWDINRKQGRFIIRTYPGTHAKKYAYSIGVILRDVLKVTKNMHEAKKIVNAGKVKIDNIIRYNVNFAVGLMDTIELVSSQQKVYRLVPRKSLLLYPIEISDNEKTLKLLKIKNKSIIKGNKIQYASRTLYLSASHPYKSGRIAFPHKPIIIIDAPSFVNLPNPSSANGHIPAQTIEFAKPNNTTNQIEISAE